MSRAKYGLLSLLVLALGVAACTGAAGTAPPAEEEAEPGSEAVVNNDLDAIQSRGYLRVGFPNSPPFSYLDDDNNFAGLDPAVLRAALEEDGLELEPVFAPWGSLISGVQSSRIDITGSLNVTPSRCEQVAFSNPYFWAGDQLVVEKGNPLSLHSYEDIAESGATLGIVLGTAMADSAREAGVAPEQIEEFPDVPTILSAVQTGRVDASAGSIGLPFQLKRLGDPNLELVDPFEGGEKAAVGFVVRQGNSEFLEFFNERLDGLRESGRLLQILRDIGFPESAFIAETMSPPC